MAITKVPARSNWPARRSAHVERPFRQPIVPHGRLGEWDCGFSASSGQAIRVGDEIRLYYSGANYTHGNPCLYREEGTGRGTQFTNSIGLATWPLDRFVSAHGPAEGATLTTVPLNFSGKQLLLNYQTQSSGRLTVDILDPPGQLLASSQPLSGNELRQPVTWTNQFDLASFVGQPIVLRFHLHSASLYSFKFTD